ncbi:hypothetical protein GCM10011575_42190 [Microlunatus endophyticus]|uniref:NADH:quinone oxidoreductase/Mrp antiporter transmembrane domain-containing protein n=1 Tax=Microlunatus endophyticus TaxID=1716077 RepID=A0A917SGL1_9ACTN|nr:hypothetical protein GCM10011575_42190 [Microlunatus endophyticus]
MLSGHQWSWGTDWLSTGWGSGLRLDHLSGLFLTLIGIVEVPVALIFASWARMTRALRRRSLATFHASTVAVLITIVLARDVFTFVLGWEGLTLLFYLLAGYPRHRPGRARASLMTVGISKVGGAALLMGLLLLVATNHATGWQQLGGTSGFTRHGLPYLLLIVAFAAKVGLAPLHVWMPEGYAAAPGPARALMSGVATLVGFYGLWRTAQVLGRPPLWLIVIILVMSGITALLGIAHTTIQQDLRRLISYSSVENAGLIVTGYGVGLTGIFVGAPMITAVGMLAATLQMITHAVAKSALFGATATFELRAGTTWLDHLRGLGRRMPVSGAVFGIGAVTLAGLPPTAGFVSEWFLLEALLQQFRVDSLILRLALAVAGALLALTAGFATVAFVRIIGLVILGADPDQPTAERRDTGVSGRIGLILLGGSCLALSAAAPWVIHYLARGLTEIVPSMITDHAVSTGWVLGPVFRDFSVLSPTWLWIELPTAAVLTAFVAWLLSGRTLAHVRRVPAWRSATDGRTTPMRYTPFGYANPTRRVLASVLLTRSSVQALENIPEQAGTDIDPRAHEHPTPRLGYRVDVVELFDRYGYQPLLKLLDRVAHTVTRVQSGRLDAYLGYMLGALIILISIAVLR